MLTSEQIESANEILRQLIERAEAIYGQRDTSFDIGAVSYYENGPQIGLDRDTVTVYVGPLALKREQAMYSNLAHEAIHVLNPRNGHASYLEEGAAVSFELDQLGQRYGRNEADPYRETLTGGYADALRDFETLQTLNPSAARQLRAEFGSLTEITTEAIERLAPRIDRGTAVRLARKCKPR